MEFKQLVTFQRAAEQLNFTRTAEQLNFAQSSVTAHIKALEDEFGVPLFDRLGKTLVLTEAGRKLQRYTNRILALTSEAQRAIAVDKEPTGTLVIGAIESLCTYRLPPVLSAFKRQCPKVQFQFSPGVSDKDILDQLIKGKLDAAVLMDACASPDLFMIESLREESSCIVASPEHLLSMKDWVSPEDLYQESLLLTEKDCSYRRKFDAVFSSRGLRTEHIFEFASVEAIKQCVMAGLGVAVLPEMTVKKEISEGSIKLLPWTGNPINVHSQLVWPKDKWVSPALSVFLELTQQYLKEE
ncbi:MAG: LysR family transcriptional regulator [Sporolactobacillus laevolacticus]|nr:LysR family transcriptional regulator [Sporolactobacillus laevolacticus]